MHDLVITKFVIKQNASKKSQKNEVRSICLLTSNYKTVLQLK